MSRYIDASELLEHLEACLQNGRQFSNLYDLSEIVCYVKSMPTIDAVEVVRCKNCCYWDRKTIRHNCNDFICWNEAVCEEHSICGNEQHDMWTDADWFCADGERRE